LRHDLDFAAMTNNRDLLERLVDFDRHGVTATERFTMRMEAHGEIVRLRAALRNVQGIISEAAMTGFNCKDGDWPDRLFSSQQMTSRALKPAPSNEVAQAHGEGCTVSRHGRDTTTDGSA
jgi:hypothetical protein